MVPKHAMTILLDSHIIPSVEEDVPFSKNAVMKG